LYTGRWAGLSVKTGVMERTDLDWAWCKRGGWSGRWTWCGRGVQRTNADR